MRKIVSFPLPTFVLGFLLTLVACAPAGPVTTPNDREWSLITADYQWIQTIRASQKQAPPTATRKEQIELLLDNHKKLEQMYVAFVDKTREYMERTGDPRAGALLAREKIILGDEYMSILARYDKAIALYREALELDPASPDARARIATAEQRRYVGMTPFAPLRNGVQE